MQKTALYRFFDKHGNLLYVGISISLPTRLVQHGQSSPFFTESVNMTVEWFDSREDAIQHKKEVIQSEKPKYNVNHNHIDKRNASSDKGFDENYFLKTQNSPRHIITTAQLKYLTGLGLTKSMKSLSEMVNVSQPTLSCAIKDFENKIGLKIYKKIWGGRGKNTVEITDQGVDVINAANDLNDAFLKFEQKIKLIKKQEKKEKTVFED